MPERSPSTASPATECATRSPEDASAGLFAAFCTAAFLLSIAYGTTFLLALLVVRRGGDEADAGLIISSAMVSTVVFVIASGHLADRLGAVRAIALAGAVLAVSCVGFAATGGTRAGPIACALLLGLGWGVFYTLGPIAVASIVSPARRMRRFALLSGSMMSGIGAGPLLGRGIDALGWPLESAWWIAAGSAALGALAFARLAGPVHVLTGNSGAAISKLALGSAASVVRSKALAPIVMVGLGGAIFGGLSSFQTSYAAERGLDYATFFTGFMAAAIGGRLFLSGLVARAAPTLAGCALTVLMAVSVQAFAWVDGAAGYLLVSIGLGLGYGLTYSVINAMVANRAPDGLTPQALVVFSLAYFVGVFGFPLVAGRLVADVGSDALLTVLTAIAVVEAAIAFGMLLRVRRGSGQD